MPTTGIEAFITPLDLMMAGQRLLHLQCWLWGQDIRRTEGNLLLAFGFERKRPPEEIGGSTQYLLKLKAQFVVRLWGFGFAYGPRNEQIFVNRYDFRPRLLFGDRDRWEPPSEDLPFAPNSILLESAARWIASYEVRVTEQAGKAYRDQLILQREDRQNEPSLAEVWLRLADELADERHMRPSGATYT